MNNGFTLRILLSEADPIERRLGSKDDAYYALAKIMSDGYVARSDEGVDFIYPLHRITEVRIGKGRSNERD